MAERPAESHGTAPEEPPAWWRSRGLTWAFGSIVGLFLVGALSSGLYPDSMFASLVTGMTWSLAWLTLVVVVVGFGGSSLVARRH